MKVRYLAGAVRNLNGIFAHIARDNPLAADRVIDDVRGYIDMLRDVPDAGRPLGGTIRVAGVPRRPYQVYYRRLPSELRTLRVRHDRRRALVWS